MVTALKHSSAKIQKIAFIKHGNFSYINDSVLEILTANFPNFQIEVIDVFSDLISKKDLVILVNCLKEYGKDILIGKKKISLATYLRTTYVFKKINKIIVDKLAEQENYAFTFQTQETRSGLQE